VKPTAATASRTPWALIAGGGTAGHVLPGIGPDDVGRLRPRDLLNAADLYELLETHYQVSL